MIDFWHASAVLSLVEALHLLVADHTRRCLPLEQKQLGWQLVRTHAAYVPATVLENVHRRRRARSYLI